MDLCEQEWKKNQNESGVASKWGNVKGLVLRILPNIRIICRKLLANRLVGSGSTIKCLEINQQLLCVWFIAINVNYCIYCKFGQKINILSQIFFRDKIDQQLNLPSWSHWVICFLYVFYIFYIKYIWLKYSFNQSWFISLKVEM